MDVSEMKEKRIFNIYRESLIGVNPFGLNMDVLKKNQNLSGPWTWAQTCVHYVYTGCTQCNCFQGHPSNDDFLYFFYFFYFLNIIFQ